MPLPFHTLPSSTDGGYVLIEHYDARTYITARLFATVFIRSPWGMAERHALCVGRDGPCMFIAICIRS